jgi:hypothetical protein
MPGLCCVVSPEERAQGTPGARCTRDLVCKNAHNKAHTSIQVQSEQSGIPCAMALRLITCSPRRRIRLVTVADGLTVDRKPGRVRKTSASLTPATGARTTRLCRATASFVLRACMIAHGNRPATAIAPDAAASTASRPNVRDDGQRPSFRNGMARADRADLPDEESGIFFVMGLDRKSLICPSGTIAPPSQ